MITVEDFIKQSKKIKREEIVDSILRVRHGPFIAIGDYFDGIYKGKFHDGKIPDILGFSNVASAYGHGSKYYEDDYELIFNEMIANYSEIIKSSHPQEGIEELRFFIGNKLVNMIETYYKENILTLNYELEQKQR